MRIIFTATELNIAARKALDFWYKQLKNEMTLKEFLNKCKYKKNETYYVVTYNDK